MSRPWHGSYRDAEFSDSCAHVSFTRYCDIAVGVIGHDIRKYAITTRGLYVC
jgi:hypothetical protein